MDPTTLMATGYPFLPTPGEIGMQAGFNTLAPDAVAEGRRRTAQQFNPMALGAIMAGLASGRPVAGFGVAERMRANRQLAGQAMFNAWLDRQRLAETLRHNLAMERKPPETARLAEYYLQAPPEVRAIMEKTPQFREPTPAAVVNVGQPVTATEAESYAATESLIGSAKALERLLEGDVDLSNWSGLWAEAKAQPTVTGAALRTLTGGIDADQAEAVRLAKSIEAQAVKALGKGDISDAEYARIKAGIPLIGGPDGLQTLKDMIADLEGTLGRRRQYRGQPVPAEPSVEAPSTPSGVKILSIKKVSD